MRKVVVVAVTVAILTLVPISGGCGEETTQATAWVPVIEDVHKVSSAGIYLKTTTPFELTGAPCRLRYETVNSNALCVYLMPQNEPAKRQMILDRSNSPVDGETTVSVEPGAYYLEMEGVSNCLAWHLWLEEQR